MIVFRYLSRQLLQAMAAVTLVLLVVALTGRFIQYLGQAVAGELATDALFLLIIFRLPDFLLVIVPLAFFLSILLVYGRMYAENEMVVLIASGFSERKLVRMSLGFAALVMFLVGSLSLVLAPWGVRKTEELLQAADGRVYLPLRGFADSLNLSVAAALVLHQSVTPAHYGIASVQCTVSV